jgi:hypothetical protein
MRFRLGPRGLAILDLAKRISHYGTFALGSVKPHTRFFCVNFTHC